MSNPLPEDVAQSHVIAPGHHPTVEETSAFTPTNGGMPTNTPSACDPLIGTPIGRYQLLQKLGEGGMGSVYLAEQSEPVKRQVALKLIRGGVDSRTIIARFEAERQALAVMDHPNIARIYDGGTTESHQPFFVMELVQGEPITEYCDKHRLSPKQRLELFVPICQAVQHAHQKGIIHRDLKPSNVLVTEVDGMPVPKVIDFGVAKATEQPLTEQSLGDTGAIVGTPTYMSPEQADPESMDIDTRTDIYALGVILYELLTGSLPIDAKQFRRGALLEVLRMVREVDPPRPSTKLSTSEALPSIAANRNIEPKQLQAMLRGDIDWIVMKAIEKDRGRRYETANGFAADVQRYLIGEAVLAHPPSRWYLVKKFVNRNKGKVLAASLVLLSLLAGIAGTTAGLLHAVSARRDAEKAEAETLNDYRASTDDAIEQLIGSKIGLGPKEKKYLENTLKRWLMFANRQGDDERSRTIRAEGHHRVGLLWDKLGRIDESKAQYEIALDMRKKLADEFPTVRENRKNLAESHNSLGILAAGSSKWVEADEQYHQALTTMEKLTADFPEVHQYRSMLAVSHNNLAIVFAGRGKWPEAEKQYRKALAILEKLVADFPTMAEYRQALGMTHNNLGALLAQFGRQSETEEQYRKALQFQEKLAADFPDVPSYHRDMASSLNNLGKLLQERGQGPKAEEMLRQALETRKKLAVEFPVVTEYRHELGRSHNTLGALLAILGKRSLAEEQYRSALTIQERLVSDFPAEPEYRDGLSLSHNNLGQLLGSLNKALEALEHYRQALTLREKLSVDFPDVPEYRERLATTHSNLALQYVGLGKRSEAETEYRKALAIREKLVADFPAVPKYQIDYGGSCCNFGLTMSNGDNPTESLKWFGRAINCLQAVYKKEPRDTTARLFLRNSHSGRAKALDRLQKFMEAVKDWDRVIELSSIAEQPSQRVRRANSQVKAIPEVAELTKNPNGTADQWYEFACVYSVASSKIADKKQEYADRAMELLQKAVKVGYMDAAHMTKESDLDPLRDREDFKKLIAEVEAKTKK